LTRGEPRGDGPTDDLRAAYPDALGLGVRVARQPLHRRRSRSMQVMSPSTQPPHAILYDGVCGLCNRLVRFILPRDRRERFRFAPLQGAWARSLLLRHGQDPNVLETFWAVEHVGTPRERVLPRSAGILMVLRELGLPWRALTLLAAVPRPVLDAAYSLIARLRYRLFGRHETCQRPPDGYQSRFVDLGAVGPPVGPGAGGLRGHGELREEG
jgi:predicted DCC family thiol-disulfide oxidoreductase YuxK